MSQPCLKHIKCQPFKTKISFKKESIIKTFGDKQKLRKAVTSRSPLKERVNDVFSSSGKRIPEKWSEREEESKTKMVNV